MTTISIHEAKTHFSKLIQRALAGEEIVVAKGKKPLVRLQPLPEAQKNRVLGARTGMVRKIADDFDEPLEAFDAAMR